MPLCPRSRRDAFSTRKRTGQVADERGRRLRETERVPPNVSDYDSVPRERNPAVRAPGFYSRRSRRSLRHAADPHGKEIDVRDSGIKERTDSCRRTTAVPPTFV